MVTSRTTRKQVQNSIQCSMPVRRCRCSFSRCGYILSPRKSPVEVVQTVGRVMRIAPNKKRGYVILPIVVQPSGIDDLILNKNKDFDVVWEILNALKSIDPTLVGQLMARQVKSIQNELRLFLSLIKVFP